VFSAYGIGFSDLSQSYQIQVPVATPPALIEARETLLQRARRDMFAEGWSLEDCELEVAVLTLDDDTRTFAWAEPAAPPAGRAGAVLLRLDARKPIARLAFQADHGAPEKPAATTLVRRVRYADNFSIATRALQLVRILQQRTMHCRAQEDDFFSAQFPGDPDLCFGNGTVEKRQQTDRHQSLRIFF